MFKKTIVFPAVLLLFVFQGTSALAGPFEIYVGFIAKSDPGVVAAIDQFFTTDDSKGYDVFLVEAVMSGDNPATHFVVARYDDYAAYDDLVGQRPTSLAWQNLIQGFLSSASPTTDGMGIVVVEHGEGWPERDEYVTVFNLNVRDAGKYVTAFNEMLNSDTGKAAPGSTLLMSVRFAGAAPTHYVVMSAPSFAALNNYIDTMFASDDYADFIDEVEDIRDVVGTAIYRKVKTWSN